VSADVVFSHAMARTCLLAMLLCLPGCASGTAEGGRPSSLPLPQFTHEERARLVGPATLEPPRIGVDPSAAGMHVRGTAILRGIIDANGRVQAIEAVKTLPPTATMDLIERGLRAARDRPAELDGKPVAIGAAWIIDVDAWHQQVTVGEPKWPAQ
jgi:hypothetical protein